ncbi:HU family DNA-binding protein [Patescibacteria group bacterium]|nr:HU family DNA-binding protein [Patescibacteria group bacterium]
MNKSSLADVINGVVGGTKVSADKAMDSVIEAIVSSLKRGEEVSIAGFGIFTVKQRKARLARNPKTGATVNVPATKVAKFKAAKALKEAVK